MALDRFGDFLRAPLSGHAARAVLILATAICHGYVLLALLSIAAGGDTELGAEHHGARRRAAPAATARSGLNPGVARARHQRLPAPFVRRFDRPFAWLLDGAFAISFAHIGSIRLHSALCGRPVLPTFPRQVEVPR